MCTARRRHKHTMQGWGASESVQSFPNIRPFPGTLFPCINPSEWWQTGKIYHNRGSSLILYKFFMQTGRAPRGILWAQPHTTSKPKIRLSLNKCLNYSALKSRSKLWNEAFLSMFHYFWTTVSFGHTNFIHFRGWMFEQVFPCCWAIYRRTVPQAKKTHLWRSKKGFPANLSTCYISQYN